MDTRIQIFRADTVDDVAGVLDVKPAHMTELSESPLPAYVINEDYYGALSDLVFSVVDAINQWKTVPDPFFIDYENAQISTL